MAHILNSSVSRCMVGVFDEEVINACASLDTVTHHGSMAHSWALKLKVLPNWSTSMDSIVSRLNVSFLDYSVSENSNHRPNLLKIVK